MAQCLGSTRSKVKSCGDLGKPERSSSPVFKARRSSHPPSSDQDVGPIPLLPDSGRHSSSSPSHDLGAGLMPSLASSAVMLEFTDVIRDIFSAELNHVVSKTLSEAVRAAASDVRAELSKDMQQQHRGLEERLSGQFLASLSLSAAQVDNSSRDMAHVELAAPTAARPSSKRLVQLAPQVGDEPLQAENGHLRLRIVELEALLGSQAASNGRSPSDVAAASTKRASFDPGVVGGPDLDTLTPADPPARPSPAESVSCGRVDSAPSVCAADSNGYLFPEEPVDSGTPGASRAVVKPSASFASCQLMVEPPTRAFVINVRRLVEARETLELLHELIKNTAIAALTLVGAESQEQFLGTAVFIGAVISTFWRHMAHWDTMDTKDLQDIVPLLPDDSSEAVNNPNRLLKAMSVGHHLGVRLFHFTFFLVLVFFTVMWWFICLRWWVLAAAEEADETVQEEFLDGILGVFIANADDASVTSMQAVVFTLMFTLHCCFELLFFHETCAVMPRSPSHGVWDPRTHGVPWRFKLLGLPSMWFSSSDALDDLKHWIDCATPVERVSGIYPQEIAFFALTGHEQRREIQEALKHAKLFDGKARKFVNRENDTNEPEPLNISLCFFDAALQSESCPYPGDFLSLPDDDDEPESADFVPSHAVSKRSTLMTRRQASF